MVGFGPRRVVVQERPGTRLVAGDGEREGELGIGPVQRGEGFERKLGQRVIHDPPACRRISVEERLRNGSPRRAL